MFGRRSQQLSKEDQGLSSMANPGQLYSATSSQTRGRSDTRRGDGGRSSSRSVSRSRSRSRSTSVIRRLMGKKPKPLADDDNNDRRGKEGPSPGGKKVKDKKVRVKTVKSKRSGGAGDDDESVYSKSSIEPKLRKIKKKKQKYKTHRDGMDSDGEYGGMASDGETASLDDGSRDGRSINSDGVMANAKRKVRRRKKPSKKNNISSDSDLDGSISSLVSGETGKQHRERSRRDGRTVQRRSYSRDSSPVTRENARNRSNSRSSQTRIDAITVPAMSSKGAELMDDLDNLFPEPKSKGRTQPRRGSNQSFGSMPSYREDEEDFDESKNDGTENDDDGEEIDPEELAQLEMQAAIQRGVSAGSKATDRNGRTRQMSASSSGRPPIPRPPESEIQVSSRESYPESGSWKKRAEDSGITVDSDDNPSRRDGDNETVHSMAHTVSSLNRQLDTQRDETMTLQKQLTDALAKVAALSEDLRREENAAMRANALLTEAKTDLSTVLDEKAELTKQVGSMEDELQARDERIEKLQQVVETQLDTVEFLEEKLEKTEDELFAMEDEFKTLENEGLLDKSVHVPKHSNRTEKMDSIRTGRLTRKESLGMERQQSRRLLMDDIKPRKRTQSDSTELDEREKKIETRERELLLQREDLDRRELRLEEWERELMEMDEQIKLGDGLPGDIATNKEKLLERRERRLEESRAHLQREKAAWSERLVALEREKLDVTNGMTMLEKEQQVKALKVAVENLEKEKAALMERNEREDRLWDYPQQVHKLETENRDLRQQLEESKLVSTEDEEIRRSKMASMEDEIKRLRKKAKGSIDPEEYMKHMQDEIAEQLNELDDENQKLNDKLLAETERFEAKLKAKEDIIFGLEESLAVLKRNVSTGSDSADQISGLLEEISDLKKANRDLSSLDSDLADALDSLEKKEEIIQNLEKQLSNAHGSEKLGSAEADEDDGKDLLIRELQNQLVAAKKKAHELSSGDYMTRLKLEVKKLKEGYNDLKKRLKQEESNSKTALKGKDSTIASMEKTISQLQMDLERRERREKNLGVDAAENIGEGSLQRHIEDLEDEIDHWKTTNAGLENELNIVKTEASEWKAKAVSLENDGTNNHIGNDDDDCSLGSVHSFTSHQSKKNDMEGSNHSFSSLTSNDLFFVSDSASVRSHRSNMTSSLPAPPGPEEPSTPSQRALRSVSNLWSKMRNNPAEATSQMNPAIPYSMRNLDDD